MKKLCVIMVLLALVSIGNYAGTTRTKGYVTKKGTYVAPHSKTKANKTQTDNWSSKGNVNPYTGKAGTKNPKK